MKKKHIYIICVLVFFVSLLVFTFRKNIFQYGNPIPYIEKMVTLNEDKKFAKIYDDKDIYITKNGDHNDLHKYVEKKYNVVFLDQMGSDYIFISSNNTVILTSEIYWSKYEISKITIKKDKTALHDLSIDKLREIRGKDIDKNLKDIGELDEEDSKNCKGGILDPNWQPGLVAFINNNYTNLSEKEKLIKEIKIIDYANSQGEVMDPSGSYFQLMNEYYQLSEYLINNNKSPNFGTYENLKFIIQNIEDVANFVDYDVKTLISGIKPDFYEFISEDNKKSLNEEFEKIYNSDNLNLEIKKEIKKLLLIKNKNKHLDKK